MGLVVPAPTLSRTRRTLAGEWLAIDAHFRRSGLVWRITPMQFYSHLKVSLFHSSLTCKLLDSL